MNRLMDLAGAVLRRLFRRTWQLLALVTIGAILTSA